MSWELDHMRKRSQQKVEAAKQLLTQQSQSLVDNLGQMAREEQRVSEISRSATVIIDDLERDFKRATKLTDVDVAFLFLAAALQCVRQYVLTPMSTASDRLGDQEAANKVKWGQKEHSDRNHRLYNPSCDEILHSPVPFDVNDGSRGAGEQALDKGLLSGYGYLGHRGATVGHDPILGLIFGTANIATSTVTLWGKPNPILMSSYHVATGDRGRDSFLISATGRPLQASTIKVLDRTFDDKLMHQGLEGKKIVGVSACKEILHLASDVYSKDSLPLPAVSAIDPRLAGELAKRGLDMAAILDAGKQFAYAVAIDTIIAFVHSLFYDDTSGLARSMYEVRTRRVLLYSNVIASASNVVVSAVAANLGGPEAARKVIDWGGYLNTLRHLVLDTKFIQEVKRDFLKNELYAMITGPQYDFMEGR